MKLLSSFHVATSVMERMKQNCVFVSVTEGKYKGTVGRIKKATRHNFERHSFLVEVEDQVLKFCGSILVEVDVAENTCLAYNSEYQKEHFDCNERLIEVGQMLACASRNHGYGLIFGTVVKIDEISVHVRPFMMSGAYGVGRNDTIRITKPDGAAVMDRTTSHAIMLQKMSAGDISDLAA